MTLVNDLREVYGTILKLPEATKGAEIGFFVKEISRKRQTVFRKIREEHWQDRVLILEAFKQVAGQYPYYPLRGDSVHRKTAYRQLKALEHDIKQLEFDIYKQEGQCNCELRKRLALPFDDESRKGLNLLKRVDGPYDRYDVYQCHSCNMRWVFEYLEDDDGSTRWMPWNEKEYPY
jgi:hypothetical protein